MKKSLNGPKATVLRYKGDARDLSFIKKESIDLIVTSPPYWQRRDYGHRHQLGQESSPEAYIRDLVSALDGWSRVLRPHASVFLNLGDSYLGGYLVGIPALFELAAREAGWKVVNHIVWAKRTGRPEPLRYRLASRYESIFHLTRAREPMRIFVDPYALACDQGRTANPGDYWEPSDSNERSDVWKLYPARNKKEHLAPFPPELAQRAILLACPERVCPKCGRPHTRVLKPTADLDPERPQAKRAMELFRKHRLTAKHLVAIRAVGISDAGKGKQIQNGSGKNATHIQDLAQEAKEALGGYFREFTFAPKRMAGWKTCGCRAATVPGTVLDPFMGSGTTLDVAAALGRHAIGVDLVVPPKRKTKVP